MTAADIAYLPEDPAHDPDIEAINEAAFGPGRFARAAYKIREGGPHERGLSFVAFDGDELVASVRLTRVAAGEGKGLMLGPLVVRPSHKDRGIGKKLVKIACEAAANAGHPAVILVGDEPYYGPLGFRRIPYGQVSMPRPVDPKRVLVHEIAAGAGAKLVGLLDHEDRKR
jgi:predicted N-acetyltransferase YhbS